GRAGLDHDRGELVLAEDRADQRALGPDLRAERRTKRFHDAGGDPGPAAEIEGVADFEPLLADLSAQIPAEPFAEDALDRIGRVLRLVRQRAHTSRREPLAARIQLQAVDLAGEHRILDAADLDEAAARLLARANGHRLIDDDVNLVTGQRHFFPIAL